MPSFLAPPLSFRLLCLLLVPLLTALPACAPGGDDDDTSPPTDGSSPTPTETPDVQPTQPLSRIDSDNDGSPDDLDCDDDDPRIHPGADEACDEIDNDCDTLIDEDGGQVWYPDQDLDGFRSDSGAFRSCARPLGALLATAPIDCDDTSAAVYPGALEVCDGLDNDCDLALDEGLGEHWMLDADQDGAGDPDLEQQACTQPAGFVPTDAPIDCDDSDPFTHPDADELCDGTDNDCDALVDEDGSTLWYMDEDGDGYGAGEGLEACNAPAPGYVPRDGDCVDTLSIIHPGAIEACDGTDNDCDGTIDDVDQQNPPKGTSSYYRDEDGDGYGTGNALVACEQPFGYAGRTGDCDDRAATTHPGADEVCNGVDDDCDSKIDDVAVIPSWYVDEDGDGAGAGKPVSTGCQSPGAGYTTTAGDCDDEDMTVFPGALEVCNGKDDDCDGKVDANAEDATLQYPDDDCDGYGSSSGALTACGQLEGFVDAGGDCDDTDGASHPGAIELCDLEDNDCDGRVDEDLTPDSDGDGACNGLDPLAFSDSFDDLEFSPWTVVDRSGTGVRNNWYMNGTTVTELSDAGDTFAVGPDMGTMRRYTVAVRNLNSTMSSNASGIVFGYRDARNYWLARWLDPTNYYKEYPYGGHIDLVRCVDGTCEVVAGDDGTRKLSRTTWVGWSVTVDESIITITFDGVQVVHYDAGCGELIGPDRVGMYSLDNDGGTQFDDFKVTVP